jgi:hypothetical protein
MRCSRLLIPTLWVYLLFIYRAGVADWQVHRVDLVKIDTFVLAARGSEHTGDIISFVTFTLPPL